MRKFFFGMMLITLSHFSFAQLLLQEKTDSVGLLVKKYFNEKSTEKLYGLGGEAFHKNLSMETFRQVCENNLFPLGEIKEAVFEEHINGLNKYKAVFSSLDLSLFLSLDKNDKVETLLFQPYSNDKPAKNSKTATTNALATPLDKSVDEVVQPYITRANTVGLSIGILKDGKFYFYGYGEMIKGSNRVPAGNTIFEIGSISKTFTAALLADAVDKGKVKLNDPANKYLPDSIVKLEFEGVPVTLQSLANHSSGIPRLPSNLPLNNNTRANPYKDYDDKELFEFYKTFVPVRRPGEKYEYSNLATGTLGVILERVNKKSYEQLLIEKICGPLGMNDTRQFIPKTDSSRFAKGYNQNGEYSGPWDWKSLTGAGSIRSTASDLLKYAKANLDDASSEPVKAMQLTHAITFSDGQNKVGLGWHYIKPGNDEVLFHNGSTGGYRSYLAINPKKKFAVVILSNASVGVETVGDGLMKWLEAN